MWILFAFGSAFFAGLTGILAKCGMKKMDSTVATALRTIVVLLFSWLIVFSIGSQTTIGSISGRTFLFLILSGLATGASWLCYFRALQLGDVNKIEPVKKSSIILTVLLAFLILGESVTPLRLIGLTGIGIGTFLMIQKKKPKKAASEPVSPDAAVPPDSADAPDSAVPLTISEPAPRHRLWLPYAFASTVFAALTSIFGKIGIENVESNLGTAIRTVVVLIMAWGMVFISGKQKFLARLSGRELLFLVLSGLATGGSWLCYYRALQEGDASVVVPIDKLSILLSILFAYFVFGERLTRKSAFGLFLIVAGTLIMIDPFVTQCVSLFRS